MVKINNSNNRHKRNNNKISKTNTPNIKLHFFHSKIENAKTQFQQLGVHEFTEKTGKNNCNRMQINEEEEKKR